MKITTFYMYATYCEGERREFGLCVHELRKQGYRKIGQEQGGLNYFEYYRKNSNKKKVIAVVMLGDENK